MGGVTVTEELLSRLSAISEEEAEILGGKDSIDRNIYMQGIDNTINSKKLLSAGKFITIRHHTRFIDFPQHKHDYVEVVYMCKGKTTHIVNGKEIVLNQGELLFLSQNVTHEIKKAESEDVAVNFIVLPDFFTNSIEFISETETPLKHFLVDCLCGQNTGPSYLHFRVSEVKPIQNLVENLLYILLEETHSKRKLSQMTMTLLFMQLLGHTETLVTDISEDSAILKVLRYIETNYKTASLAELSKSLHYDLSWLSREIKKQTGKTFTELVQDKRLSTAAFLLKNTNRNVADISLAVGYENVSYFHRIFTAAYQKSPKHYRDCD